MQPKLYWCMQSCNIFGMMWGDVCLVPLPGKLQDIIHIVVEPLNVAFQALREAAALLVDAAH